MIYDITGRLVIDAQARHWCKLPYPGHAYGCPNFRKKKGCPPEAPLVMQEYNLELDHWLAVVDFNLKEHMERMGSLHPSWSERQRACCLYWQGGVRKRLKELCQKFIAGNPEIVANDCPEALGVDVFKTAERMNIHLERNPREIVYKIALIGTARKPRNEND